MSAVERKSEETKPYLSRRAVLGGAASAGLLAAASIVLGDKVQSFFEGTDHPQFARLAWEEYAMPKTSLWVDWRPDRDAGIMGMTRHNLGLVAVQAEDYRKRIVDLVQQHTAATVLPAVALFDRARDCVLVGVSANPQQPDILGEDSSRGPQRLAVGVRLHPQESTSVLVGLAEPHSKIFHELPTERFNDNQPMSITDLSRNYPNLSWVTT